MEENLKSQTQLLIETLKKINYINVEQLVEDINRNFAVVENSPLFKGLPGGEGKPGTPGLRGTRGNQFIFVYLDKFLEVFPKELQSGSNITLEYLNSKLLNFETKQLLFKACGVSEFVNNDIIVLTNSTMLSYELSSDKLINSGIAFNEQSNIISSIEKKIEEYVKYYVENNQTILNLQNIFEHFTTIGKNYSDTNNTFVTRRQSGNSALVPYVPGLSNTIGTTITDHKYYGFAEKEFPLDNKGTIVFGSIAKYTKLILDTMSVTGSQTISGGYVPTDSSIPSVVFLQDTYNAGILFGYKSKTNLKRFASIYKNDSDELVFKSDMGNIDSEYSSLYLHKNYLRYNKLVDLLGDIHLLGDYEQQGAMKTPYIRTGKYTEKELLNDIEIGRRHIDGTKIEDSTCYNESDILVYDNYIDNVFVTDGTGILLKTYFIEKTVISPTTETDLGQISPIPNSQHNVVTSNYLGFIIRKFNSVCAYISSNYWRKNQWNTGEIPDLSLSNNLSVGNDVTIGRNFKTPMGEFNETVNKNILGKSNTSNIINGEISFQNFGSNVLVSDGSGNILHNYKIETAPLNKAVDGKFQTLIPNDSDNVLTSNYLHTIQISFNESADNLIRDYWSKSQWNTGVIPVLNLSDSLIVGKTITNKNFEVTETDIKIGTSTVPANIRSTNVRYNQFTSCLLATDAVGNVLKNYSFETNYPNFSELPANILITPTLKNPNKIISSEHLNFIEQKINNLSEYLGAGSGGGTGGGGSGDGNFWTKQEFTSGIIPSLELTNSLIVGNSIRVGRGLNVSDELVVLGHESGGSTRINSDTITVNPNFINKVFVVDTSGNIMNSYEIEKHVLNASQFSDMPDSSNDAVNPITLNGLDSNTPVPPSQRIVTTNYLMYIIDSLNAIKQRFTNTYNKSETLALIGSETSGTVPIGTIIIWTPASSSALHSANPSSAYQIGDYYFPIGWSLVSELNDDVYARGCSSTSSSSPSDGGENNLKLDVKHLPDHRHQILQNEIMVTGETNKTTGVKIPQMADTTYDGLHSHRQWTWNSMDGRPNSNGQRVWMNENDPYNSDRWTDNQGNHKHQVDLSKGVYKNPYKVITDRYIYPAENFVTNTQIPVPDQKWVKMWYLMKN